MRWWMSLCSVFMAISMISSHSIAGTKNVKAEDYGDDWPFPPYKEAMLKCELPTHVYVVLEGITYGLNGSARGIDGVRDSFDIIPIDEYGAFRGQIPTVISILIKDGLELCE